jgi:SAM-dependent methyltransferase
MSTFVATDPEGYEPYVGRWSRRLAPLFIAFAGVTAHERILDVGCGTGNLTRALGAARAVVTGIDLSAPYIGYARQHTSDAGVTFEVGDAQHLPYPRRHLRPDPIDVGARHHAGGRAGARRDAPCDAARGDSRGARERLPLRLGAV